MKVAWASLCISRHLPISFVILNIAFIIVIQGMKLILSYILLSSQSWFNYPFLCLHSMWNWLNMPVVTRVLYMLLTFVYMDHPFFSLHQGSILLHDLSHQITKKIRSFLSKSKYHPHHHRNLPYRQTIFHLFLQHSLCRIKSLLFHPCFKHLFRNLFSDLSQSVAFHRILSVWCLRPLW